MSTTTITGIPSVPFTWAPRVPSRVVAMRRRRAVAVAVLAAILTIGAWVVIPVDVSATATPVVTGKGLDGAVVQPVSALREHRVVPGDTVWQLAVSMAPDGDPRPLVDRIVSLNGLTDLALEPGQTILLPTGL